MVAPRNKGLGRIPGMGFDELGPMPSRPEIAASAPSKRKWKTTGHFFLSPVSPLDFKLLEGFRSVDMEHTDQKTLSLLSLESEEMVLSLARNASRTLRVLNDPQTYA